MPEDAPVTNALTYRFRILSRYLVQSTARQSVDCRTIALNMPHNEGLVGKFWRPVITYAQVAPDGTLGVGPGAHIVVGGVLDLTRQIAETQTGTDR